MNIITNRIRMDLMKPTEQAVIHAVQGECNTRQVQLSLFCDGNPWEIPADTFLAVRYGRIGQGGGYYDTLPDGSCAYRYEGNTVTVTLAPQMMTAAGVVTVQLELHQGEQMLATFSFKLMVDADPAMGIREPETYINWKNWLEQELDAYIETVKTSGEFLGGTMAGSLNMNGNAITGIPAPSANDQAVNRGYLHQQLRKTPPRNLLDNSDFTNPVNQRGSSVYTEGYTIDRWRIWDNASGGTLSVTDSGIKITVGSLGEVAFIQTLPDNILSPEKIYTYVLYFSDGSVHMERRTFTGNEVSFGFRNAVEIAHAALYEGEYTADTLPMYQPKGYGVELAECLRYFERLGGHSSEVLGNTVYVVGGFSSFISSISYYPKRIPNPTVKLYDPSNYRLLFKTADTAQVFGATDVESFGDITAQSPFATITVNLLNAEGSTCWVMLQRADNAPNAYIDICADL